MLVRFALQAVVAGLVVAVGPSIVPGIDVSGLRILLPSAVIVGLANAAIRPLLRFALHPVTVPWVALMALLVNGMAVLLGPALTMGWTFDGVGAGVAAVVGISAASVLVATVPLQRGDRRLGWGLHEGGAEQPGSDAMERRPRIEDDPEHSTAH